MPDDALDIETPRPAPRDAARAPIHAAPLFAWLALQMLALLAGGFRVPLSARFPAPEEQMALHEMLVVQVVGSALLFPTLFPTLATGILAVAAVPVMTLLAAILASRAPDRTLLAVAVYTSLWVAGLAVWAQLLRTTRAKLGGVAVATLLALGGGMLAYLNREFGAPTEPFDWSARGWLGPLVAGMSLLESGAGTGTAWAFLGSFLAAAVLGVAVCWWRGRGKPPAP
jgi:hypothetical protein